MENVGETRGVANPDRRCRRRRNAPPVCSRMRIRRGWNNRNEYHEWRVPCANCVRAEQNRLAAQRHGQRRRAFNQQLRAENAALSAEYDEVSRVHQEELAEQERMRDLIAAVQVAKSFMEELKQSENGNEETN